MDTNPTVPKFAEFAFVVDLNFCLYATTLSGAYPDPSGPSGITTFTSTVRLVSGSEVTSALLTYGVQWPKHINGGSSQY